MKTAICFIVLALSQPASVWPKGEMATSREAKILMRLGPPTMQCLPDSIAGVKSIRIVFPAKHGSEFAVVRPTGKYLFISFPQPNLDSPVKPVIPPEKLTQMAEISTTNANFVGVPWSRGESPKPVRVFREAGSYLFLLGSALEGEDKNIDGWCKVKYRPLEAPR